MHHLDFEKVIDKLSSKYEAVVRMAAKARKISNGAVPEGYPANMKVTSMALQEFLKDYHEGLMNPDTVPPTKE